MSPGSDRQNQNSSAPAPIWCERRAG